MEGKHINKTDLSPEVKLSLDGSISIKGRSMMEDSLRFYKPIHEWTNHYIKHEKKDINIIVDLDYFNSSSAKQLLKLFMIIDIDDASNKIIWVYPSDNEFIKDRGEEFEIMLDITFEYQAK